MKVCEDHSIGLYSEACEVFMLCFLPYNTECSELDDPVGGLVSVNGIKTNDVAVYSCYVGLYVHGNETRVCMNNSQWSGKPPECRRKHTNIFIHQLLPLRTCSRFTCMFVCCILSSVIFYWPPCRY